MADASNSGHIICTIRVIRSFEYRNLKNLVVKDVDPNMTIADFKARVISDVKASSLPLPFKTFSYDTLKIEHQPFKAKSNDPVINCEDDDLLILVDSKTVAESNIGNETEISLFKMEDYLKYKADKHIILD